MCGAVRFVARDVPSTCSICHCEMCRRWTGSALIGVSLKLDDVVWADDTFLGRIQSSPWAERGFCTRCGTGLYFRVTMESAYSGKIELPVGVFDDPDGFEIASEIYIDHKPGTYAFEDKTGRKVLTRADCVRAFPVLAEEKA